MANDIMLAKSGPIKNGTMIHSCNLFGTIVATNTYVTNSPTISEIEAKYDDRFDNPSYYYGGGGGADGGDVGGDVLGV